MASQEPRANNSFFTVSIFCLRLHFVATDPKGDTEGHPSASISPRGRKFERPGNRFSDGIRTDSCGFQVRNSSVEQVGFRWPEIQTRVMHRFGMIIWTSKFSSRSAFQSEVDKPLIISYLQCSQQLAWNLF
jgi:hypothetical protein